MNHELLDYKVQVMNGTGNSFAITSFMNLDHATQFHTLYDCNTIEDFVVRMCNLLKVDGFILLTEADSKKNDYKWFFYNNDGSKAEMCGNAARCVGHFTFKNHVSGDEHSFESLAGTIDVIVENEDQVTVAMPELTAVPVKAQVADLNYTFLDTGVPHSVIELSDLETKKKLLPIIKELRQSTQHHVGGSNVTLFESINENLIKSVSFERGVEDFTQACGTGAVAAAHCQFVKTGAVKIQVQMPGGAVFVDFSKDKPYLIGPIEYGKTFFPEELKELWTNSFTA